MSVVRVKYCGITNLEDAQHAAALGVDALGFVFYRPSPRFVTPAAAAEIISALPPFVSAVGLFVNATAADIEAATAMAGIDTIQFHGDESPAFCAQFQRPWIKAIAVREHTDIADAAVKFEAAGALLLDTYNEKVYGGTGEVFDWNLIGETRAKPLILAGGLTANNVSDALRRIRPYAVDVSGGIEVEKGKKDPAKMKAFIEKVRDFETAA